MSPLWLCSGLSGATALALELLWMRSAGLVLGHTATTTGIVLACYFLGIGLGAAGAQRIRRQPVWWYSRLTLGTAAGALWSLAVFRLLASEAAQQWLVTGGIFGRAGAVCMAVLPATVCLGAIVPALGEALVGPHRIGRRGALLYAVNTFGGVAGIAAAGFGLPALIGVSVTYLLAATLSTAAGLLALSVTDPQRTAVTHASPAPAPALTTRRRLRLVAAGTGFLALGLEVLWTRLFAQVLHNSVYSFAAIAMVFVVAIALGATVAAWLLRYVTPTRYAAVALLGAAGATVGGAWFFVYWTQGLTYLGMESGVGEYVARIVALSAATAGPTALAGGTVLPALWASWGGSDHPARPLGNLSAANTFGAIAGALVAGFLAIPELGIRTTLLAIAVGYVILASSVAPSSMTLRAMGVLTLLGIWILNPNRIPLVHLERNEDVLHATLEGSNGIVTVVDRNGDLQLRLDNFYVLGGTSAATNERRLGLVPLLLHPAPRDVAFIGLATGITASAAPALGVDQTTVIELVPEVATAARDFFGPWNGHLFDRSDVRVVLGDGRRYLAAHPVRFDVIVSDLFIPWHVGTGDLYAREAYLTIKHRLAPGGLFCQWLPLYQMTRDEFDIVVHTFLSVFPNATLWRADFYPDRPVVGLVGRLEATPIDLQRVGGRVERMPPWSHDALLSTPRGLAMLYLGDLTHAADVFTTAPLNTYDDPIIEFTAPRLTRMSARGDKDWFTHDALAEFSDRLVAQGATSPAHVLVGAGDISAAQHAGILLYRYALAAARHDAALATALEADVRGLVPEVVAAADAGDSIAGLADARRAMTELRAEQQRVQSEIDAMERRLAELGETVGTRP